jgi:hypothetical protein
VRVLGIDPGPTESAWVLWDGAAILGHGKVPNHEITISFFVARGVGVGRVAVAIEMIQSFGMAVGAEVFETCVFVGRLMERAGMAGGSDLRLRRVFRKDVKMHLCHSMRAKDPNIRQALIDKVGPPGKKSAPGPTYGISGDCWAALAVAVTAFETWLVAPGAAVQAQQPRPA